MESNPARINLSPNFTGQVVLITGGGQGIGAALCSAFLSAGAAVVVVDLDKDRLLGQWDPDERTLLISADVSNSVQVTDMVEQAIGWRGQLDIVVNNAGITRDTVIWKMTDQQWSDVLAVHLTGTFNVTRAAIPYMRSAGFGRIINVTSFTGLHGNIGQANYAAAKAGIIGFTKTVAKETARFGITANVVSPNAETAMVAAIPPEKRQSLINQIPMERFGKPEEMASAVLFLASSEAGYMTGIVLPVDGGMSM
jgi:3-oxoacyl-[acyl-carrier protein] reductase